MAKKFMPITYYPVLVALGDGVARFERTKPDGLPEFGVEIPMEYWVKMGRPGAVRYTPDAWIAPDIEWLRSSGVDAPEPASPAARPEDD